jgi:hypothetical protein
VLPDMTFVKAHGLDKHIAPLDWPAMGEHALSRVQLGVAIGISASLRRPGARRP